MTQKKVFGWVENDFSQMWNVFHTSDNVRYMRRAFQEIASATMKVKTLLNVLYHRKAEKTQLDFLLFKSLHRSIFNCS